MAISRLYAPNSSVQFAQLSNSQTLSGSSATVATPLFRVTGSIQVRALWGVVTTTLGANQTACHWRINDQTAQPVISLVTGTTISGATAGSVIARRSLVSVALVFASAAAGAVTDPVAATAPDSFMPFLVTQKTGGVQTDIEFVYTTTDAPTSGVIQHFLEWRPISANASVVAV